MSDADPRPRSIAGGAHAAEPTFADVNRDVLATLHPPGNLYFAWMCVVGLILTCGILAWTYQIFYGMGAAGKRTPQMWAMYITTFVFWIGIGHAGTLISAVLYLFRARWRTSIYRAAEAMTIFAVLTAGLFPLIHAGRMWFAYFLLPYPNQRYLWPNFKSPLVWDVFAISTYLSISTVFFIVGLVPDLAHMANLALKSAGDLLVVIGREDGHLGQSLYQLILVGKVEGAPPPVDLADEIKAGNLVRTLIREGKVGGVHDVSDGGLLVAIAEMALAGEIGVQLFPYEGKLPVHAAWFGEDQARYVLEATPELVEEIVERARLLALPARVVGRVGGSSLNLKGEAALTLEDLRAGHEAWLPHYMGAA